MVAWTRAVVRHRRKIIAAWLVLFVLGGAAASQLGKLLSNRFSVPGSDAERGLNLAKSKMGERGDGDFTVVFQARQGTVASPRFKAAAERAAQQAAHAIKGGKAGLLLPAGPTVAYTQIATPLQNADAANKTPDLRKAIHTPPSIKAYVSGFPAINHDTQKIYNKDLAKGESIAVLVALVVMGFMFGTLGGIAVPFAFAFITIPTTLGFVWIFAHLMDMAVYVTNIVSLIGIAIAVDYSMLVVFRYREELEKSIDWRVALERTMATAGRATLFSGGTVAVGLALLVFMPLPFMRSMGVGGLLVPLISIVASATFLPALLAVMGRKINSLRFIPRSLLYKRAFGTPGFWSWLARSIMRRPVVWLVCGTALMLAIAWPVTQLHLTGGDNRGVPKTTEATRALLLLDKTLGPGALAPHQLIVDTGKPNGAWSPQIVAAQQRLIAELRRDSQVTPKTIQAPALAVRGAPTGAPPPPQALAQLRRANLVDATGRYIQLRFAGKGDAGTPQAVHLVRRTRDRYIPAAGFKTAEAVYLTGAPAFGVDFTNKAYSAFPWLVAAVLVLSYFLLLRAFRSVLLPIKAVLMNLLSVSATYGALVLVFQHGLGKHIGFQASDQIEAWIPIFLFAMLFGLSMDYEVFMLSRMREEWDHGADNERAVSSGLEHTGRIITAAAIIMIAAFSGFTAGSFVGLQMFGFGLSIAILLDATIVRAILVPATMKLIGNWNWWLPERIRRVLRLSPVVHPVPEAGGK